MKLHQRNGGQTIDTTAEPGTQADVFAFIEAICANWKRIALFIACAALLGWVWAR